MFQCARVAFGVSVLERTGALENGPVSTCRAVEGPVRHAGAPAAGLGAKPAGDGALAETAKSGAKTAEGSEVGGG